MEFGFTKILGSNESGYSGDEPDQRGKYVLINKDALKAFPHLSKKFLNDSITIRCRLPLGDFIGLNLVYHNAKYFPETHDRAHDEVRLYRSSEFEEQLNADRGVLIVFYPIPLLPIGNYALMSFPDSDPEFELWRQFNKKLFLPSAVEEFESVKSLKAKLVHESEGAEVEVTKDILSKGISLLKKGRKQQDPDHGDPASPLVSLIKSQQDFSQYLREMYDNKCCVRETKLIDGPNALGIEAAHIRPHMHGGPLLPTNGILLSADLHQCFEKGAFTLTEDSKIEVHPKVPKSSKLWKFDNKEIAPSFSKFEVFKPYSPYIDYHRENIFKLYSNA